jgi:hypothetical protein
MKHKIIIHQVNGRIVHISASGSTEIILIESAPNSQALSKLEPDLEFESGKAHEMFTNQEIRSFLEEHQV